MSLHISLTQTDEICHYRSDDLIDFLEKEHDDLLYNYRLLKDKIRRLKRRTMDEPPSTLLEVYLEYFLTDPNILFCLLITLSIYRIFLVMRP